MYSKKEISDLIRTIYKTPVAPYYANNDELEEQMEELLNTVKDTPAYKSLEKKAAARNKAAKEQNRICEAERRRLILHLQLGKVDARLINDIKRFVATYSK